MQRSTSSSDAVRNEAYATAYATARAEGVKSVRQRARGILTHAEAKGSPAARDVDCTRNGLDREQAAKVLAAAPTQIRGAPYVPRWPASGIPGSARMRTLTLGARASWDQHCRDL